MVTVTVEKLLFLPSPQKANNSCPDIAFHGFSDLGRPLSLARLGNRSRNRNRSTVVVVVILLIVSASAASARSKSDVVKIVVAVFGVRRHVVVLCVLIFRVMGGALSLSQQSKIAFVLGGTDRITFFRIVHHRLVESYSGEHSRSKKHCTERIFLVVHTYP